MTSPASLVFYLKYLYTGLVNEAAGTWAAKGRTGGGATLLTGATEYGNFAGNTWNIDPYYSLQTVWREANITIGGASCQPTGGVDYTSAAVNATPVIAGSVSFVAIIGDAATAAGSIDLAVIRFDVPVAGHTVAATALTCTLVDRLLNSGAALNITASGNFGVTAANAMAILDLAAFGGNAWILSVAEATIADTGALYTNIFNRITYDYDMENNRLLPEIDLSVERATVAARTRKLRTKWSVEASQDLRSMHNIDAEKELVALLANEVAAEIDREILNELIINAGIRVEYDYSNAYVAGGLVPYSDGAGATTGFPIIGAGNFDDRNRALLYQIIEVSNQIYRQSLRGSGNWVVTCPEIAAKLESLREFNADAMSDFTYNLGIQVSGTLQNKFKLYKDPLFPTNLILVGFKGSSFMDAGFFYCPYVPLQITPTVLDPESFNPRKGLLTRYGTVMVENGPRMYGVIRVSNLTARGAVPAAALATSATVTGRTLLDPSSNLV